MAVSNGVLTRANGLRIINKIRELMHNATLKLYTNALTPGIDTLISEFTEATFTGYAAQVVGDGDDHTITAITNADPAELTSAAHALATGDLVDITGFTGAWVAANARWPVTVTAANTFTIPVDSTAFGAIAGAPVAREVVIEWANQGHDADGVAYLTTEVISFQATGSLATSVCRGFWMVNPLSDTHPFLAARFHADVNVIQAGDAVNFVIKLRADGLVVVQLINEMA